MPFTRVFLAFIVLWIVGGPRAVGQIPKAATIKIPTITGWATPATVTLQVTGFGRSQFTGSNGKAERGSPYWSFQVEPGALFYPCDFVTGFPDRTSPNSPFINRKGASSFIAVKPGPNGKPKVWLCASVGAYRISGGATAEWEYQVRYFSGDTALKKPETLSIGIVPNADFYGGVEVSGFEVKVDFAGQSDLSGTIGDRILFANGYKPGDFGTVSVLVTNAGPAAAIGDLNVAFYLATSPDLDKSSSPVLGVKTIPSINLAAGGSLLVTSDPLRLPPSTPKG